jgi:hypothetical protein
MTLLAIGASARQPGQTLLLGVPVMIHWRVLAAASDIAGALTLPYPVRLVPRERLSATDIRIPRIERKHLRPLALPQRLGLKPNALHVSSSSKLATSTITVLI